MPELPEVETIKRDLNRLIVGKKILDIGADSAKQTKPSLQVVKKAAVGQTIKKIGRRAKLLQIFLSNGKVLAVHLKLTGRLLVRKKSDPPDDWLRVLITLSGGRELRFCDLRKFGWIRLVANDGLRIMNDELGMEPFDKEFTTDYLQKIFSRTSKPVKLVLMDQEKIAGIGNIYANEALFEAGILPRKPANKLSNLEIEKLRKAIIKVLKEGLKYGGSSARDEAYIKPTGEPGKYQEHFRVYQREGEKCPKCGSSIKRINLAGRGTFFCPKCQR